MKKRMFIIIALVAAMLLSTSAMSFATASYADIKTNNWAYEAVNAMSQKTIVKGYPDGTFKPNNTLAYGEFIKMALVAATGNDVGNSTTGNWATNYYNKALELKYFTAADIALTDLDKNITRAKMALIISAVLGDVKLDNAADLQKSITDVSTQTAYKDAILKAYASGILTGYEDKTFKPNQTLTRAEAATVMYRFVEPTKRVMPNINANVPTTNGYTTVNLKDYVDTATVKPMLVKQGIPNVITGDFTAKAELYSSASTFDMSMNREWNGRGCSFNHTMSGFIYLVKDKKVIAYCQTTPHYDADGNFLGTFGSMASVDVKTADYIVCVPSNTTNQPGIYVKIVSNPFK